MKRKYLLLAGGLFICGNSLLATGDTIVEEPCPIEAGEGKYVLVDPLMMPEGLYEQLTTVPGYVWNGTLTSEQTFALFFPKQKDGSFDPHVYRGEYKKTLAMVLGAHVVALHTSKAATLADLVGVAALLRSELAIDTHMEKYAEGATAKLQELICPLLLAQAKQSVGSVTDFFKQTPSLTSLLNDSTKQELQAIAAQEKETAVITMAKVSIQTRDITLATDGLSAVLSGKENPWEPTKGIILNKAVKKKMIELTQKDAETSTDPPAPTSDL